MAHDAAFDDPWLKWRWAAQNAKAHEAEMKRFLEHELDSPSGLPFTTDKEYHPEFHGFSVFVATIKPSPDWWGLWLGDILHAYRSSLDHLAWILVDRGSKPVSGLSASEQRKIYFPCARSRNWFNAAVGKNLPGCRRTDIARVRAAQPYKAGKRLMATHPLLLLDALSNSDKHRVIQPVHRHQEGASYRVTDSQDCLARRIRIMPPVVMKVGTEIARIYVKRTGTDPDLEMKGAMAARIGISEGLPLDSFLKAIQIYVAALLLKFSDPPDNLVARAAIPPLVAR